MTFCEEKVKKASIRREFAYTAPEAFGKGQPLGHTFVHEDKKSPDI